MLHYLMSGNVTLTSILLKLSPSLHIASWKSSGNNLSFFPEIFFHNSGIVGILRKRTLKKVDVSDDYMWRNHHGATSQDEKYLNFGEDFDFNLSIQRKQCSANSQYRCGWIHERIKVWAAAFSAHLLNDGSNLPEVTPLNIAEHKQRQKKLHLLQNILMRLESKGPIDPCSTWQNHQTNSLLHLFSFFPLQYRIRWLSQTQCLNPDQGNCLLTPILGYGLAPELLSKKIAWRLPSHSLWF